MVNTRRSEDVPNADVQATGNEEGRQLHTIVAQLQEAWPDLALLTINGREYQVKGTSFDEFVQANERSLSGIESLKIDGDKASLTVWPGK